MFVVIVLMVAVVVHFLYLVCGIGGRRRFRGRVIRRVIIISMRISLQSAMGMTLAGRYQKVIVIL